MTFYWLRVIINDMKKNLSQEFEIRDLGKVNAVSEFSLYGMAARLSCIKREYIEDTLKCFGMTKSKPVNTSMDPSMKLTLPEDASDIQKLPYHELIETLTYLVVATRPYCIHCQRIHCQLTESVQQLLFKYTLDCYAYYYALLLCITFRTAAD